MSIAKPTSEMQFRSSASLGNKVKVMESKDSLDLCRKFSLLGTIKINVVCKK